jgi:hypothetical protein
MFAETADHHHRNRHDEHFSYVAGAITMSAAAVEAA